MRRRRLPRPIERELAKFLGTIGFAAYGELLWELPATPEHTSTPLPPSSFRQILDQARHEPAVVAAGEAALPNMRCVSRTLLDSRGVSSAALLDGTGPFAEVVLIAPNLDTATTDKIKVLVKSLRDLGARTLLVIVTDKGQAAQRDRGLGTHAGVRLLFWPDRFSGEESAAPRHLALLVHVLGAPVVISLHSRLGLETIGWYGRALKSFHRLYTVLDVPHETPAPPFTDIYYLRLTASHATALTLTASEAETLRLAGAGLHDLHIEVASKERMASIFGDTFEDRRSPTARAVASRLLGRGIAAPATIALPGNAETESVDITVTIVFHGERDLAVPALASLHDMLAETRRQGIRVEARAMLDKADEVTRRIVHDRGAFLDEIRDVSFGDLASVRNASAQVARGRFLAFLDGDDLWGAEWLSRSFQAATQSSDATCTVWHPEALFIFWASDCDRVSYTKEPRDDALTGILVQPSAEAATFEPRDLLFENMWSANCFAARALHLKFPYRPDDWSRQIGIEDWRFNLETLGQGIRHLVVPETVHLIRMKEGGSLGQTHDAKASLPLLD